ncbi:SIR2 family protein [uncultured Marinococcus sp.]|uniref:SIR2 family protein n=1 Tax=uncultured Marinococcus sp. TaxID=487012 RepID=UPI002627095F|nr:SIR2 family protein [uncultured Marinococcus sp.]
MEKVVYILGAGFSAPLNLPVMSNFIIKAKDMYFEDKEKYSHFESIFELLDDMSKIKNFFQADLYNIEEILSILEMNDYLNGESNSDKFRKFIKDVIVYYTPKDDISSEMKLVANWEQFILGNSSFTPLYRHFVANLFNLEVEKQEKNFFWKASNSNSTEYSIVTLNYDRVIENVIDYIEERYETVNDLNSLINGSSEKLSKLHGCVSDNSIIPPTWNKNTNHGLKDTWQVAWRNIKDANHIRFIGYSLPVSDSYIKYFLKSAMSKSEHLKSIDVITLDNSKEKEIEQRYKEFIDFNYFRFKNGNIIDYLKDLKESGEYKFEKNKLNFNHLERVHSVFMNM